MTEEIDRLEEKLAFQEDAPKPQAQARSGVLVPAAAVRRTEGRNVLFVLNEGRVERRAVPVSEFNGTTILVESGLAPGERVVVDPPAGLVDGDAVREKNQ